VLAEKDHDGALCSLLPFSHRALTLFTFQVHFLDLPPSVLRRILLCVQDEKSPFLLLNKFTLEPALAAYYSNVQLKGRPQIASFAASIVRRPSLLRHVREFGVSDADSEDGYWERFGSGHGRDQLSDEGNFEPCFSFDSALILLFALAEGVYDPSGTTVGIGLLEDLLLGMKNLHALTIAGAPFHTLLSPDFLAVDPFPLVRNISLLLPPGQQSLMLQGLAVFGQLSSLRALKFVGIAFLAKSIDLPLSLLNLSPSSYLPPRSLHLQQLALRSIDLTPDAAFGAGMNHLFAALSESFKNLFLEVPAVSLDFIEYLSFLPTTLVTLSIYEGAFCDPEDSPPHFTLSHPKIGSVLRQFIHLKHLHLRGDILSCTGFNVLPSLPHLKCLLLGPHLDLCPDHLHYFDPSHPLYLRHLTSLTLHLCYCNCLNHLNPNAANWPPSFSARQGRELLKVTKAAGIEVQGSFEFAVEHTPTKRMPKNGIFGRKLLRKTKGNKQLDALLQRRFTEGC
jgi:hypothetical protein